MNFTQTCQISNANWFKLNRQEIQIQKTSGNGCGSWQRHNLTIKIKLASKNNSRKLLLSIDLFTSDQFRILIPIHNNFHTFFATVWFNSFIWLSKLSIRVLFSFYLGARRKFEQSANWKRERKKKGRINFVKGTFYGGVCRCFTFQGISKSLRFFSPHLTTAFCQFFNLVKKTKEREKCSLTFGKWNGKKSRLSDLLCIVLDGNPNFRIKFEPN